MIHSDVLFLPRRRPSRASKIISDFISLNQHGPNWPRPTSRPESSWRTAQVWDKFIPIVKYVILLSDKSLTDRSQFERVYVCCLSVAAAAWPTVCEGGRGV